jgi:hypothetical protein
MNQKIDIHDVMKKRRSSGKCLLPSSSEASFHPPGAKSPNATLEKNTMLTSYFYGSET